MFEQIALSIPFGSCSSCPLSLSLMLFCCYKGNNKKCILQMLDIGTSVRLDIKEGTRLGREGLPLPSKREDATPNTFPFCRSPFGRKKLPLSKTKKDEVQVVFLYVQKHKLHLPSVGFGLRHRCVISKQ